MSKRDGLFARTTLKVGDIITLGLLADAWMVTKKYKDGSLDIAMCKECRGDYKLMTASELRKRRLPRSFRFTSQ